MPSNSKRSTLRSQFTGMCLSESNVKCTRGRNQKQRRHRGEGKHVRDTERTVTETIHRKKRDFREICSSATFFRLLQHNSDWKNINIYKSSSPILPWRVPKQKNLNPDTQSTTFQQLLCHLRLNVWSSSYQFSF